MKWLILTGFWLLSACNGQPDPLSMFQDYQQRVANLLEQPTRESTPRLLPALPHGPQRRFDVAPLKIGWATYFETYRCDLNQLISQRNSGLGKVLPHSQRLIYEAEVSAALDRCAEQVPAKLARELRAAAQTKRQQLPQLFWNTLIAGPEFNQFVSSGQGALNWPEDDTLNVARQALQQLALIHQGLPAAPTSQTLEQTLRRLALSEAGGRLARSLSLAAAELDATSQILEQGLQQAPPCPFGRATPRGRYLFNVFQKYYAGQVQPYLSYLNRDGQAMSQALLTALPPDLLAQKPTIEDYLSQTFAPLPDGAAWQHFQQAVARHVKGWQDLLGSCQLGPSKPD